MKILIIAAMALALGGCANFKGVTGGPLPQQVTGVVEGVQNATKNVCAFIPTAKTVIDILRAFGVNTPESVTSIATRICDAVTKVRSAQRGARPTLRAGNKVVVINGRFVR